eukprot:CAMPEP_0184697326 /NCGR_PEP_ID=MMETSP0313-20130426/4323_1 /TAXON_ID=2792 /ORGANISM="Porphyridium aerugineum, Strain SAG 1380-2" /LENGTH=180 /DNA_ID=CAMNT_0027156105 /DNA_START=97 /DNA_END=639 /DNA_ORIENTATION=-
MAYYPPCRRIVCLIEDSEHSAQVIQYYISKLMIPTDHIELVQLLTVLESETSAWFQGQESIDQTNEKHQTLFKHYIGLLQDQGVPKESITTKLLVSNGYSARAMAFSFKGYVEFKRADLLVIGKDHRVHLPKKQCWLHRTLVNGVKRHVFRKVLDFGDFVASQIDVPAVIMANPPRSMVN